MVPVKFRKIACLVEITKYIIAQKRTSLRTGEGNGKEQRKRAAHSDRLLKPSFFLRYAARSILSFLHL